MSRLDMARLARPPAPQSKGLRRLRIISAVLLLLSALCVALIDVIRALSLYLVAVVPLIMCAALVCAALHWWRRSCLERYWWTDERDAGHREQTRGRMASALNAKPRNGS